MEDDQVVWCGAKRGREEEEGEEEIEEGRCRRRAHTGCDGDDP
jgi:hypothetical protein